MDGQVGGQPGHAVPTQTIMGWGGGAAPSHLSSTAHPWEAADQPGHGPCSVLLVSGAHHPLSSLRKMAYTCPDVWGPVPPPRLGAPTGAVCCCPWVLHERGRGRDLAVRLGSESSCGT